MSSVKNIAMILDDGKEKGHQSTTTTKTEELGYFGNIWVRQHFFDKIGALVLVGIFVVFISFCTKFELSSF